LRFAPCPAAAVAAPVRSVTSSSSSSAGRGAPRLVCLSWEFQADRTNPLLERFWFPKSLEYWLRLSLVYCNTKDNPLQTSGFPINLVLFLHPKRFRVLDLGSEKFSLLLVLETVLGTFVFGIRGIF
jgi:hypothetical protein